MSSPSPSSLYSKTTKPRNYLFLQFHQSQNAITSKQGKNFQKYLLYREIKNPLRYIEILEKHCQKLTKNRPAESPSSGLPFALNSNNSSSTGSIRSNTDQASVERFMFHYTCCMLAIKALQEEEQVQNIIKAATPAPPVTTGKSDAAPNTPPPTPNRVAYLNCLRRNIDLCIKYAEPSCDYLIMFRILHRAFRSFFYETVLDSVYHEQVWGYLEKAINCLLHMGCCRILLLRLMKVACTWKKTMESGVKRLSETDRMASLIESRMKLQYSLAFRTSSTKDAIAQFHKRLHDRPLKTEMDNIGSIVTFLKTRDVLTNTTLQELVYKYMRHCNFFDQHEETISACEKLVINVVIYENYQTETAEEIRHRIGKMIFAAGVQRHKKLVNRILDATSDEIQEMFELCLNQDENQDPEKKVSQKTEEKIEKMAQDILHHVEPFDNNALVRSKRGKKRKRDPPVVISLC